MLWNFTFTHPVGFRCKKIKNVIDFHLFWFASNLQRNRFIELLCELGAPILGRGQKNFRFWDFLIRSFKFLVRCMFSFRCIPVYPRGTKIFFFLGHLLMNFLSWNKKIDCEKNALFEFEPKDDWGMKKIRFNLGKNPQFCYSKSLK